MGNIQTRAVFAKIQTLIELGYPMPLGKPGWTWRTLPGALEKTLWQLTSNGHCVDRPVGCSHHLDTETCMVREDFAHSSPLGIASFAPKFYAARHIAPEST